MEMIVCIGCGCDELNACPGGCAWVAVDEDAGVGLCSHCSAKSVDELMAIDLPIGIEDRAQ